MDAPSDRPLIKIHLTPTFSPTGTITALLTQIEISTPAAAAPSRHESRVAKASAGDGITADQGGVVGIGRDFFPHMQIVSPATRCVAVIEWDLAGAPSTGRDNDDDDDDDDNDDGAVRAVCSFGEGMRLVVADEEDVTFKALLDSVYMVGPVQSHPARSAAAAQPEPERRKGVCATYWLGTLPGPLRARADFASSMFPHVSAFFFGGDAAGAEESYRVFFRHGGGGSAGLFAGRDFPDSGSSLVEYDDDVAVAESDWEVVRLLTRCMVRRWAWLDAEKDGVERNDWFADGLAGTYSIYFPYRFKFLPPDYFRAILNGTFTAYFTSPLIDVPTRDVLPSQTPLSQAPAGSPSSSSSDPELSKRQHPQYPQEAPFLLLARSTIYMIRTDSATRRASRASNAGVLRPIDEIVAELCARRRRGETVRTRDWLDLVGKWIGRDAATRTWDEMMAGRPVMQLDDMRTSFDGIDPVEQEVLEFGFERDGEVVRRLVPGSRAALAGLLDGDRIVWHSRPGLCAVHVEATFRMRVERDGQEVEIAYWPRSERKARGWVCIKKDT